MVTDRCNNTVDFVQLEKEKEEGEIKKNDKYNYLHLINISKCSV